MTIARNKTELMYIDILNNRKRPLNDFPIPKYIQKGLDEWIKMD